MLPELADTLVWILRALLVAGLGWGAWLAFSHTFLPHRAEKLLELEHFATLALLVVLLITVGSALHAG